MNKCCCSRTLQETTTRSAKTTSQLGVCDWHNDSLTTGMKLDNLSSVLWSNACQRTGGGKTRWLGLTYPASFDCQLGKQENCKNAVIVINFDIFYNTADIDECSATLYWRSYRKLLCIWLVICPMFKQHLYNKSDSHRSISGQMMFTRVPEFTYYRNSPF
jgi:hypothetical protein